VGFTINDLRRLDLMVMSKEARRDKAYQRAKVSASRVSSGSDQIGTANPCWRKAEIESRLKIWR
jgi:hypothetical protein